MLLSVAAQMSSALNAIQQEQGVSRAAVSCSVGMLWTQLATADQNFPGFISDMQLGFVLSKGVSGGLTRCQLQVFVSCLVTGNSQGTAFV